jgi:hypothetical protein
MLQLSRSLRITRNNGFLVFHLRKGVEVNMWDLENCTKIWAAKSVSLFIFC